MPIYEYRCKACSHELEVIQKLSEEPLKFCPECGQPELTKLVSAAGFRLKGGGWYETDFKSGDKKKNLAGDQAAPTATAETAKPAPAATETKTPAPSAS
jgi:putative FmdB family regulatory protein